MKAIRQNSADILAYAMVSIGLLSLGLMGASRIDLLISEPFGSLMVFSRTIFMIGMMAGLYALMRLQQTRRLQRIRVRA